MIRLVKTWLTHPLTRGLNINDPRTTFLRRRILTEKKFLRLIYDEWYRSVAEGLPPGNGPVLELGTGAGFLDDYIVDLITSDIFPWPHIRIVLNGMEMPMANGALRSIVMIDVLHHIPNVRQFLVEAARCIQPGGAIIMLEPWVTFWSRLVYSRLHDESFETGAVDWHFETTGPLSAANGALPWMLFARDREQFEREFPMWQIKSIKPIMPFRYLLSGGMSMRSLMPGWCFGGWRFLEGLMQPWIDSWAMFARIVLVKRGALEAGKDPAFTHATSSDRKTASP